MLLNIVKSSFINQKKSMILMIVAVAVGTALAASLITLSLEISSKVSKELRSFGANILVQPKIEGLADISGQQRYLNEDDIIKVKTIFWRHNILGLAPFLLTDAVVRDRTGGRQVKVVGAWYQRELPVAGEEKTFTAGISSVFPWWAIEGVWPATSNEIILGTSLAAALGVRSGDQVILDESAFTVSGILSTGGPEDDEVFMELSSLQKLKGMQGKISRVLVSALTKPMDEFAYKDPETMTQAEYEKWYCTGYVTSIARQIEEVFTGSSARPIWKIAVTEGAVLSRLEILTYLLCIIAIIAAALGVSTTMITSVLRRSEEIGIMKTLGASRAGIAAIFLTEGAIIGMTGGIVGYIASLAVSAYIGVRVFDTVLSQKDFLLLIAIGSAILIALVGVILPIRRALRIKPVIVLKESR